jgi:hypothetical protein
MSEFTILPAHLSDKEASKSVKFLQIDKRPMSHLKRSYVKNIRDLPRALEQGFHVSWLSKEWKMYVDCINADGSVDWNSYYNLRDGRYHYMYFQCKEFDELAALYPEYPVDKQTFLKAGMLLERNGIETLKDLNEFLSLGIDSLPGMGKGKITEMFATLTKLLVTPRGDLKKNLFSTLSAGDNIKGPSRSTDVKWAHRRMDLLNEATLNLPLSGLHIGPRGLYLSSVEIHTLGELIAGLKTGLPKIKNFGRRTLSHIIMVMNGISNNIKDNGDVDWKGFSSFVNIPIIPDEMRVKTGKQFLDLIPSVVAQIAGASQDEVEKTILTKRLTKTVRSQSTLEELASIAEVSRERIRQKEKNLLTELSNGLLYDEYTSLEYRFRDSFSDFFRQAANAFMGQEEVTFESFVKTLSKLWNVSIDDLIPNMPFITAILTNKSMTPKLLRLDRSIPPELMVKLPDAILEKPLAELPLGRFVGEYHKHQTYSFGEALAQIRNKCLPIAPNRRARKLLDQILISVANALQSHRKNQAFWLHHAIESGKPVVPDEQIATARDYLKILKEATRLIVKENSTYKWSLDVYDKRVSQPQGSRLTLAMTGKKIGTSGPWVRTVEKKFVSMLNDQLIKRDFSKSKIYIRECFLSYWEEARVEYNSTNDFTRFKFGLAKKWNISVSELDDHADLLWTVIHRYPHGVNVINRKRRKEAIASGVEANATSPIEEGYDQKPQIIKLRGFKRVY